MDMQTGTHAAFVIGAILVIGGIGACAGDGRVRVGEESALAPVAFLEGTWRTREEGGESGWTEEHWTAPAGGSMLGGSRTIDRGADGVERLMFYEFLRLSGAAEGVVYHALPLGRSPATAFRMASDGGVGGMPGRVVFENPEHDYPTRVIYWLDEQGRLHGRIEGVQDGKERGEEWVYERVRTP